MRIITLLTDFGHKDPYVAEMKGVIYSINPKVLIVDITHDVKRHDVHEAAYILLAAYKYFPKGSIHVVVVDPGVGTHRRAIVIESKNYIFVGPDNGVLLPASTKDGIIAIREIKNPILLRKRITSTFHGRDVFVPVAAYLSLGVKCEHVGPPIPIDEVVTLFLPKAEIEGSTFRATVIHVDVFGNVITNVEESQIRDRMHRGSLVEICIKRTGKRITLPFLETYGSVKEGKGLLLINSEGYLEIAINRGNASREYGIQRGDELILKLSPSVTA